MSLKSKCDQYDVLVKELFELLDEFQNFLRGCGYVIGYNKVLHLVDMDQ